MSENDDEPARSKEKIERIVLNNKGRVQTQARLEATYIKQILLFGHESY